MALYDPSVRQAVLGLLRRWRRLPLSDVLALLDPVDRLRFRKELLEDLVSEGVIEIYTAGDEEVVALREAACVKQLGQAPGVDGARPEGWRG